MVERQLRPNVLERVSIVVPLSAVRFEEGRSSWVTAGFARRIVRQMYRCSSLNEYSIIFEVCCSQCCDRQGKEVGVYDDMREEFLHISATAVRMYTRVDS